MRNEKLTNNLLGLLFVGVVILATGCKKDNTNVIASGSVIVVNEGNFQHGNASVSVYDPQSKAITNDLYKNANGGALMSDVAQSLYLIHDTAYIVMNNSQKVVIADAGNNFKYISSILLPSGASPRYFMPVRGNKAYVTELYQNKIWIVDYRRDTIIGTISVSGWTEQMVTWNGKIYVTEAQSVGGTSVHKILEVDPSSDQVTKSLSLPVDPVCMALTDQNKLFVLAATQIYPDISGASLIAVDMPSFAIDRKLDFIATHSPNHIRYSGYTHQLLYSDNGIYALLPTDTVLPTNALITSSGWNVYGMNPDPTTGDIYISDALDYQQASHIMRFSATGTLVDQFRAGIITNGFVFR